MNETSQQIDITEVYRLRIANIVNQFMRDNWAFRERLNATEIINSMSLAMRELFSLGDFLAIADGDLKRCFERGMNSGLYDETNYLQWLLE